MSFFDDKVIIFLHPDDFEKHLKLFPNAKIGFEDGHDYILLNGIYALKHPTDFGVYGDDIVFYEEEASSIDGKTWDDISGRFGIFTNAIPEIEAYVDTWNDKMKRDIALAEIDQLLQQIEDSKFRDIPQSELNHIAFKVQYGRKIEWGVSNKGFGPPRYIGYPTHSMLDQWELQNKIKYAMNPWREIRGASEKDFGVLSLKSFGIC